MTRNSMSLNSFIVISITRNMGFLSVFENSTFFEGPKIMIIKIFYIKYH